ncbi:glycosyl transferase family protein [Paraburkholderia sp.]|uniref:glycosyl transferase family protein n=1 Tax=Paraburkholderia sp. TaxID=1926495 RepID=UPI002396F6F7|nr:glycosyl transferase family protein [Paraburkholderia sp.]MDE1180519.1 glycosyl transferase family protein [Paraburkholderia sp.]
MNATDLVPAPIYVAYYATQYYNVLQYCAGLIAVLILLSSLDDLFIDGWYWIRESYRAYTVRRVHRPLTVEQLRTREEQPIAIMVPAWREHDVIAAMIEDMVRVLDYRNYVVFVGTYPNDPDTIAEVERMRRRYKQLRRVEVPHDGPTCKADCLNWVIQAIFNDERETSVEFAGVVLHDSEDVLHPVELKFFNYLLPRKDMIQLPVASLERQWYELVAGTYMDEFAEWHAKDLVVRESLVGSVPSAGVGTCFSRRALVALSETTGNQPFNTDSLTEDYDVGARLGKLGMQSIFARFPVQFRTRRASWFGLGKPREVIVTMPLCVREFFPDTIRTAYRQRARWALGIGLQGWQHTGWSGSLANRYLLARDRKGVFTAFVGMIAYVLLIQFLLFMIADARGLIQTMLPSPFIDSTWMRVVLWANVVAVTLRVVQRCYFVTRLYGWEQGLIAIPRMVVGNFINFLAVSRAWRQFLAHLLTGKRLAWDKTMHDFPSADGFAGDRRQRLGEVLLSWQAIDEHQLAMALDDDHAREAPLGRVLMAKGWLDEETLAEAIAFQSDLPRASLDPQRLRSDSARLPLDVAIRFRVLAHGADAAGRMILLSASPLSAEAMTELAAAAGQPVTAQIVRESEIANGLRLLRGADDAVTPGSARVPLIGDLLIELGHVTRERFDQALQLYRPDRDGRIGDFMMARGVITGDALNEAMAMQSRAREHGVAAP